MRQIHKAGEKLFVDYAGQTLPIINPRTGEVRESQIFLATLGASSYTFAEATWRVRGTVYLSAVKKTSLKQEE